MQCYTELTPPTAVTHAITIPLLGPRAVNLVVAKSSLLQIFTTKIVAADLDAPETKTANIPYDARLNDDEGVEASYLGGEAMVLKPGGSNTKLVLVAEFALAGTVTGLARVKTKNTKSGGESLLLAFKDARLSLVEWDPDRHDLYTVSIHYYEQDELQGSPWAPALSDCVNFLAADPGSRCAALKFGARNLAIIPFRHSDEDMDMDDWDEDLDGPRPVKDLSTALVNGNGNIEETPYAPSFVLRLSNIEPTLLHPIHLAFLHEYREPTFGILSSTMAPSSNLGRRDHLSYMVFTLDLEQKASTTILSVNNLPQDLTRIIPLPTPVGGALLVGANELIHIDQSGRANGVAVNPLTRQSTSFGLADQSSLCLRLEGCSIDVLSADNGELLLILNDGRIGVLVFRMDGRTVDGLSIKMIPNEAGGRVVPSKITCMSRVGRSAVFMGSETSDSLVVGWTRKQTQTSKKKARTVDDNMDFDFDDEEIEDDDDDMYGTESGNRALGIGNGGGGTGELSFRIHDRLFSIAPIRDITYGPPVVVGSKEEKEVDSHLRSDLHLTCAVGRGRAGAITNMTREINPKTIGRFEFQEAQGLWTVCTAKPVPKTAGKGTIGNDFATPASYDKYMIVAKEDIDSFEASDVYAVTAAGFETLSGTEFDSAAGFTIEAGTMGNHSRIVQVLKSDVRCYDGDLGLTQILPMIDENTGAEPKVISASITDQYLLLIRDDSSAVVAGINKDGELEELDRPDKTLVATKWLGGCLYHDSEGTFTTEKSEPKVFMFLLSAVGALHVSLFGP
jgi:cleavage and polyadenylation specificity factor subunit 1